MNNKICLLAFLLCCFVGTLQAQQPIKALKNLGDQYFEAANYNKALNAYLEYHRKKPSSNEVKEKIGICFFETNNTRQAIKYFNYILENEKNPEPTVFYYLAKSNHAELNFRRAINYYKLFLKSTKSHQYRNSAKASIMRCATGMRLSSLDKLAIVENLGENVNSKGNDFNPILSPNYENKIYFSSSRLGNMGGLRNEKGEADFQFGHYTTDLYSSKIINGAWMATEAMSSLLNSAMNDVALAFNESGKVLFYSKSNNLFSSEIYVDTFKVSEERSMIKHKFVSPMIAENGDGTPFFFNDTIMLFSSRREGGYGGSDLYEMVFSNGNWTAPRNLGAAVNTEYDETTPFLAKDGRTLYYSSNNLNSIGGFDIFKSKYIDSKKEWNKAVNLGVPINSAGDDLYYKMAKDGLKAYFSSDRKTSMGESDIYTAYFKTEQKEQSLRSNPIAFNLLEARTTSSIASSAESAEETFSGESSIFNPGGNSSSTPTRTFTEDEIKDYSFKPIFYNTDDDILSSKNIMELNKVLRLLLEYPDLKVLLTSNSDETGPAKFDLYFSIKRAEKVAGYFIDNGVSPSNILIKGCGSNYPLAKNNINGEINPQGQRINRRIDLEIFNTENFPVRVKLDTPTVGSYMSDTKWNYYNSSIKGISYKVEVAAIKQMYNGEVITTYPNAMIESSPNTRVYSYTLGLYKTFSSADQLRKELEKKGITEAKVIAYIDGFRPSKAQLMSKAGQYSDLWNFIQYQSREK